MKEPATTKPVEAKITYMSAQLLTMLRDSGLGPYGKNYFITEIDGNKCTTLNTFLSEIAIAFKFPGYYGHNVNAFWDCIRDLSWITENNYVLVVNHNSNFLKDEDEEMQKEIRGLLNEVSEDWATRSAVEFKIEYYQ